ncbi:MAG: family 20 glycosylhydrolase [Verrucomicrobiae bacterium]|nr:family 20 glycosylhydrolase [Verrucomicrobiae bacterium]
MTEMNGKICRLSGKGTPLRLVRGFQWDLARQMERVDFLRRWIPRYAGWGYDEMYLYLEDAFDYPSAPGVGRKGALSLGQMEGLARCAERSGLKVVPVVPLMGHAAYLMKVPRLRQLAEIRDRSGNPLACGQICPLHEGTLKLAEKLLRDVAPFCTAGIAHVGLDESFEIGRCPECRAEVRRIGLARHFAGHVQRLHAICRRLGLRLGMWADMLYYVPEAIPLLPRDIVAYDWYYYPFRRFPKVELYNFAGADSTGRLRRAGIDVYGCPNNGPFLHEPLTPFLDRLRNILSWWRYIQRKNAQGMLITSWSPSRTCLEMNMLVDAAAASLWLDSGLDDPRRMLERGLRRMWGIGGAKAAALVAEAEKYQYAGYYRWQTHDNWRALAGDMPVAPYRREARHFERLVDRAKTMKLPVPLRNSLVMRRFIARKDVFLKEGSRGIFDARRAMAQRKPDLAVTLLQKIRRAADGAMTDHARTLSVARVLWRRSRSPREKNPVGQMLKTGMGRLRELRGFLDRAMDDPRRVWEANPLAGQWQLLFWVRNFEPALQGAVVLTPDAKGGWKTLHSLWSLEFIARAGNSRANFLRRHSASVEWDGREPLRLRLAVRGMGRLEIGGLQLTDGVRKLAPTALIRHGGRVERLKRLGGIRLPGAMMGCRAPRRGFPPIDWKADQGWVEMEFVLDR